MEIDVAEMFTRFITVVRSTVGIPDEMTIEQYLQNIDVSVTELCMRVEITWDGGMSFWTMYFDSTGRVIDDEVLFGRDALHKLSVEHIIRQAPHGSSIVEILTVSLPKLQLICDQEESEDFGVYWEWCNPVFAGYDENDTGNDSWPDGGWQTAEL